MSAVHGHIPRGKLSTWYRRVAWMALVNFTRQFALRLLPVELIASSVEMSRIPQPKSSTARSTPSSPTKKTPSKPTTGTSRVWPPPSPTPSRATPTLRPQASAKSLRSTTPTKPSGTPRPATLGRRTQPPVIKDEPPLPKAPALSVREQIALRRAELQKASKQQAQDSATTDDFQGLEDASPIKEKEDIIDLGRWSVKETIERARSTGEHVHISIIWCANGLHRDQFRLSPAQLYVLGSRYISAVRYS